ncbi:MAG: menaquinone biosynthesis protein [SAR202 cluster bacterium]|nr:menaquinone biosynthesis protein [SAR202 cluster bacterium]
MPIRVGQIPYLNSEVFYHTLRGRDVQLTPLVPRALSAAAGEGRIDAGPVPLVTCFELEDIFKPLGDFCIGTTDRARSILFYSKRPIEELDGAAIAVTGQTSTTVRLLKVLLAHKYNVQPKEYVLLPQVFPPANGNSAATHWDAFLLIGDDALRHRNGMPSYPHCYDLGEVWNRWTGLPFVFARWVVRKDFPKDQAWRLCQWLDTSISQAIADVDAIAARRRDLNMTHDEVVEYILSFHYRLGPAEMEAMDRFRRLLEAIKEPARSSTERGA